MSSDGIERDAQEMIEQYGAAAARVARVRAEIAESYMGNLRLAQTWRDIGKAVERLLSSHEKAQIITLRSPCPPQIRRVKSPDNSVTSQMRRRSFPTRAAVNRASAAGVNHIVPASAGSENADTFDSKLRRLPDERRFFSAPQSRLFVPGNAPEGGAAAGARGMRAY